MSGVIVLKPVEIESTVPSSEESTLLREAEDFINKLFPERKIRKVLFVVPPDADSTLFNYNSAKRGRYPNYPPYGFGAMAAHLRKDNIKVEILNLNSIILQACKTSQSPDGFIFDKVWQETLAEGIARYNSDLVGVTCMFTQTHRSFSSVCMEIRRLRPQTPLAVGGVHVTNALANSSSSNQLINETQADLFFRYESDVAFKHFVRVINKLESVKSLAQVVLNLNDKLIYFPKRMTPEVEDLNLIPAYDLMNPRELSKWGKVGAYTALIPERTKFATVLSNRGCRAQCTFCSVRNFNGKGVRRRSVQSVIDELLMLRYEYGIEHIMWLDDDFLFDRNESLKLFNEMVRQKVDMTWDCTNGVIAAVLTEELVAAAEASGCIGLNLGMESGNPEILRSIKKPGTVEGFLKAAEILRRHPGIFIKVFLIIGFPNETYRQQLDTIEVAQKMGMDWHLIQILQPLPNTPIFDSMVQDGLIDPTNFDLIHIASGAYGKVAKKSEGGRDLLSRDFKGAFNVEDLNQPVPRERIDDCWAYMNYHLNYAPQLDESRPEKIRQKLLYLEYVHNIVAPDDAMAMYFAAYLEQKFHGNKDRKLLSKLSETLKNSPYWSERFKDFNLSLDQIGIEN